MVIFSVGGTWRHETQSLAKLTVIMSLPSVIAEFIVYRKGIKMMSVNDSSENTHVCVMTMRIHMCV